MKHMLNLADTQRAFLRALFDAELTGAHSSIGAAIEPAGVGAETRLDVYRNNVFSNYRAALQAVYPVIERLVGEQFFRHACDGYIKHYASGSGDLHDFGAQFDEFLAAYAPAVGLPYLPDVARLEWQYHRIFHAAAHAPLALARLGEVDPEAYAALRFTLHPGVALLRSPFPVLRIWQINQPDYTGDQQVDLREGGDDLLVSREDFVVKIARLPSAEYEFLAALQRGAVLPEALEAALAVHAAFDLQAALAKYVSDATIVDFTLPEEQNNG